MDCFPLLIFIEYKKLGIWEKSKLCVDIGFEAKNIWQVYNIEYALLYVYYMKFMKNIDNIISILY